MNKLRLTPVRWLGSAFKMGLLLALLAPVRLSASSNSLGGDWAGGFEEGADYVFHRLHFITHNGKVSGTYDAPLLFQHGRSLRNLTTNSSQVTFEVPNKPHPRVFSGELKNGVLTGQMKEGGTERPFRFTRLAAIQIERYVGTYEIEPGHFVFLRAGVEIGANCLQFIDFKTGRLGVLFPTTPTNFFTGPAVLVPHPVEATVAFTMDPQGQASAFTWTGPQKWTARRTRLWQEEVSFTNGAVKLSGTLILPEAAPPHSVIVCVPSSTGAATREMFRHTAEFLALHGVASLIYDKRGLGRSTGDWLRADFANLADDALAGVRLLKTRAEINSHRIGLFGSSQSGWIVALAASRSQDVAFIISQSGPGVTPEEQELYRSEAWLRADGFSEEEVTDAMKFLRQRYQWARTGEGWESLAAAEREARSARWFVYTGGSGGKDNPFWDFWRLIRSYDPVPDLEKVRCPVLALYGGKDTFLPVEKSVQVWQRALEKAGNKDVTLRVFPDGDHSLIESRTGGLKDTARARRFVPGYFDTIRDWTLKHSR